MSFPTLSFKAGVAPGDVALWREGSNLCLAINGTSDRVTVQGWFDDAANRVEQVQFADGTAILEAAQSNGITGTTGNDALTGTTGSDYIDGGAGRDQMSGGKGDDTYVVDNSGDRVAELANEGMDTVKAGVSYALAANDYEWQNVA